MSDCIFCELVKKNIPTKIIAEDEDILAFRDINPQAPTHILVIPKKHISTLNDLTEADGELLGKMYLMVKRIAEQEGIAERGFRTVMNCNRDAGQTVYHIHLHILGGRELSWPPG